MKKFFLSLTYISDLNLRVTHVMVTLKDQIVVDDTHVTKLFFNLCPKFFLSRFDTEQLLRELSKLLLLSVVVVGWKLLTATVNIISTGFEESSIC